MGSKNWENADENDDEDDDGDKDEDCGDNEIKHDVFLFLSLCVCYLL